MKTFLISKTTTLAEVFAVKAKTEDEALNKIKDGNEKDLKKVNEFTTDIFYQSEGEDEPF